MGKKPRKGFSRSKKEWKESIAGHIGKAIDRVDPIKATAFVGGAYIIYKVLDNPKIINSYENIQLAGSPLLFALKHLGLFDPFRAKEEVLDIEFGQTEKIAVSLIASYLLVQHGSDMIGVLSKIPLAVA